MNPKNRCSADVRGRVGLPRTQFNQRKGRGGWRPNSGARRNNVNARKALAWSGDFDLSTPAGIDGFLQELVKNVWSGKLGSRSASSINGTLKILLEHLQLPELERRIKVLEDNKGAKMN